jgi:hypothetical protein
VQRCKLYGSEIAKDSFILLLGPVSHGRTVSFTGIRLLVFGYYEYQYLVASNRFNLSVSQNLYTQ